MKNRTRFHRRLRPRRHQRGDAGTATISIAIIFPAIAVLILALAQAVLVATARDVALSAAEEGLRIARAHGGTLQGGRSAAIAFARHEPMLLSPGVVATGTASVTVTVHGHAPSLLPGVHLAVSGTARGVREDFTVDTRGFTDPGGRSGVNPTGVSSGGKA